MGLIDLLKKAFMEGYATSSITIGTVLMCIGCTVAIAIYIYIIYKIINRNSFYNKGFNISLVIIAVITAAIILTIQSNIVVSLGMVGALSIVRFRTAIKEPLDIAFLFWAIADGIVLAAGMIPLAVFGSVLIGVVILVFANHKDMSNPYIVVLRMNGHESETKAVDFLKSHVKKCVVKSKTAQKGFVELNLEIRLQDENTDFVNELADVDGVESAVLVSYNGDYMG